MHVCEEMHAKPRTHISFEKGFLMGLKHSNDARLAGQGASPSLLPSGGIISMHHDSWHFTTSSEG